MPPEEEVDDDDDTHFCLRCRQTIQGLDEYVRHRKEVCGKPCPPPAPPTQEEEEEREDDDLKADDFFSQLELQSRSKTTSVVEAPVVRSVPPVDVLDDPSPTPRSVSRGMQTRSKTRRSPSTSPRTPASVCRQRKRRVTQSEDDDEDGWRHPPRTHTGGKWRPQPLDLSKPPIWRSWRTPSPEPEATPEPDPTPTPTPPRDTGGKWGPPSAEVGGKWKPGALESVEDKEQAAPDEDHHDDEGEQDADESVPPPNHTRGKWAPGMADKVRAVLLESSMAPANVRKSGSTVQYWCGSCNRRLASSKMYERHLQSDLHFRRTLPERQLDERLDERPRPMIQSRVPTTTRLPPVPTAAPAATQDADDRRRGRRQGHRGQRHRLERCPVCRARVLPHQVGKHLVSHFHWRSTRTTAVGSVAANLILDNIEAVVRQSPFQCGLCKYYCNSSAAFREHWASEGHRQKDRGLREADVVGQYWCSPCEIGCPTTDLMDTHLWSEAHQEVEAAVNRSVAVVVSRRTALRCMAPGCKAAFRFNGQLTRHERLSGHRGAPSTASDRYQSRFRCALCGAMRRSRLALQKHKLKSHGETSACYYCGVCSLDFATATAAAVHRLSLAHRDAVRDRRERRARRGGTTTTKKKGRRLKRRACPHCRLPCRGLGQLRRHLEDKHPDRKHRCAMCGLAFTLPQEVSRHHRDVHGPTSATLQSLQPSSVTMLVPGHDEKPPFTCRPCGFSTESRAELVFHRVLHEPPEITAYTAAGDIEEENAPNRTVVRQVRYRCPVCSKLYRKVALRSHLHVHTGERPFRCRHCDKSFSRKDSVLTHEMTSHAAAEERHPERVKVVPNQDDEERRLREAVSSIVNLGAIGVLRMSSGSPSAPRHSNSTSSTTASDSRERKHLCDVCGKCFLHKSTLRQHQMSLHGVKPAACSWPGCLHRARSAAELRIHVQTHTSDATSGFECMTCHFRARTKPLLKRHEKIHSGEKAYKCEHCNFASRVSSHLVRHRRLHTGAKPFSCPHCDHRCNNLENLRKHVLNTNKHPGKFLYECRFCDADESAFKTNLANDYKTHLALAHADKFSSLAAAASFVAGIYDKAADTSDAAPLPSVQHTKHTKHSLQLKRAQPAEPAKRAQPIWPRSLASMVKPRNVCVKKTRPQTRRPERAQTVLRLPSGTPEQASDTVEEDQEDLPTSLLPKHTLLDGELFPVVVTDLEPNQDVVFVQLEEDSIVIVED